MTVLLVMAALAAPAAPQPAPPPAPAPAPVLTSWESCEVCNGAGKVTVREPDLGQNAGRIGNKQPKKTVVCPVCEGKGRFECYRKPADLEMQMMHEREQNVAEPAPYCISASIV